MSKLLIAKRAHLRSQHTSHLCPAWRSVLRIISSPARSPPSSPHSCWCCFVTTGQCQRQASHTLLLPTEGPCSQSRPAALWTAVPPVRGGCPTLQGTWDGA